MARSVASYSPGVSSPYWAAASKADSYADQSAPCLRARSVLAAATPPNRALLVAGVDYASLGERRKVYQAWRELRPYRNVARLHSNHTFKLGASVWATHLVGGEWLVSSFDPSDVPSSGESGDGPRSASIWRETFEC